MTEDTGPTPHLSETLRALPDGQPVTLGSLAQLLGSRAHGLTLLVLALPDAVPLPLPSLSAVLGVPMVAVSLHLAVFGESGTLPRWLASRNIPAPIIGLLKNRLSGLFALGERLSRPRWSALAGRERAIGLVCLLLSLLLLLPVPFFNTPPALCLSVLAWGLIRADGAFVLAGLAATVPVLLLALFAAIWSWEVVSLVAQKVWPGLLR